ncbi:MAG: hypothetical protein H0X31_02165 [Nostocaceae cyanobacterium]|nr:hypothetical protein [Nostocaceae cyanobacterium]
MNKKFILTLLSSPTIVGSIFSLLAMGSPAHATSPIIRMQDGLACIQHPHGRHNFVCTRVSAQATTQSAKSVQSSDNKIAMLDFSEKESNDAIALFGCDCPYCVNSLRALRGLQPLAY